MLKNIIEFELEKCSILNLSFLGSPFTTILEVRVGLGVGGNWQKSRKTILAQPPRVV